MARAIYILISILLVSIFSAAVAQTSSPVSQHPFRPTSDHYEHNPMWRYTGCDGGLAFRLEDAIVRDPIRSCQITLQQKLCRVSHETCCLRQCYFFYTNELISRDLASESDAMRRQLLQSIEKRLQEQIGENDSERRLDLSYFYQCIDSCNSVVEKIR